MSITDQTNPPQSQSRLPRNLILVVLLVVGILVIVMPIRAMIRGLQGRSEGFSIDPRFSTYYDHQGGQDLFGIPISGAFIEVETGKVVQYFENARLELDSGSSGGLEVKASSLGMMLGGWETPLIYAGEAPGCRFYQETGHHVCHAFLTFYENNGGPGTFGYPISEFKIEDGRMVQYFQWFRLDWFPDDELKPIRPGPIGSLHLSQMNPDTFKLDIEETSEVEELVVVSSVKEASLAPSGEQTVYLLVRDQDQRSIVGASATLIAHFPEGDRMLVMPLTDEGGRSQVSFSFENQAEGHTISLDITVVYKGLKKQARESFMIHVSGGN